MAAPEPAHPLSSDYTSLSHADLVARISALESKVRTQTALLSRLSGASNPASPARKRSPSRRAKPFDPSLYSTRHVALKFSYIGSRYNGYEHANGSVTPKPTIEEAVWKALRKARLIAPTLGEDADQSYDVVWDTAERLRKYSAGRGEVEEGKMRLEVNWEGCQYSKCGRTDRGVSAFGQVVGIRVRSNRPLVKEVETGVLEEVVPVDGSADMMDMPGMDIDVGDLSASTYSPPFDGIKDELPYVSILNSILPPDIRVLAWCPEPPEGFDARFSCRERRYRYFFTNPAFCPTPGKMGMRRADGKQAEIREGWLDIEKMKEAAKKLEGLHDFRNLCKIDPSKQMSGCERRIRFADVVEYEGMGGAFEAEQELNDGRGTFAKTLAKSLLPNDVVGVGQGPKVYTFCVHGSAFLWHQVRCMVAIIFLVGQGLEEPTIVDELLDVKKNPCRPMYEMADDAPLVLWDCIFPDETSNEQDSLKWIYAGDNASIPALNTKGDGKFGLGGVVDELWTQWRKAKIEEVLAGSLLDLVISQGDGSVLQRGGFREAENVTFRSQKVFDGSETARLVGDYLPVMKKPKMDTLEVQNAKYLNGKKARRDARAIEVNGND